MRVCRFSWPVSKILRSSAPALIASSCFFHIASLLLRDCTRTTQWNLHSWLSGGRWHYEPAGQEDQTALRAQGTVAHNSHARRAGGENRRREHRPITE